MVYMTFVSALLFELPTAVVLDEYANSCGDEDMTVPPGEWPRERERGQEKGKEKERDKAIPLFQVVSEI